MIKKATMAPWTVGLEGGGGWVGLLCIQGFPGLEERPGVRWKESEQDDKLTYIVYVLVLAHYLTTYTRGS
jgi:hypothetical protein